MSNFNSILYFFHDIYLVLIDNVLSLYLINGNSVNRFFLSFNRNLVNKNQSIDLKNNINKTISNCNNFKSAKNDCKSKLV